MLTHTSCYYQSSRGNSGFHEINELFTIRKFLFLLFRDVLDLSNNIDDSTMNIVLLKHGVQIAERAPLSRLWEITEIQIALL